MAYKKKRDNTESFKQQKLVNDDIRLNAYKPLYLVYGEESYLRLQFRDKLKKALFHISGEMNVLAAKGEETDPDELISFAETVPFLAEKRVLLVENTGFFKRGCGVLEDYLKNPSKTAVFVFTETAVDKSRAMFKRVQDRGRTVLCEELTADHLKKWLEGRLKEEGKIIRDGTAEDLLALTGTDMSRIVFELEKLIAYTGTREEITKKDINAICSVHIEGSVFDLTDAIAEKNREKAMKSYRKMLALNEAPAKILYHLIRQLELLLKVSEMRRMNVGTDTMMRVTGKREFVITKNIRLSRSFSEPELRRYLELCAEGDRAVKSGLLDKDIAIEMVITEATA